VIFAHLCRHLDLLLEETCPGASSAALEYVCLLMGCKAVLV
jgi:hypothetical protein